MSNPFWQVSRNLERLAVLLVGFSFIAFVGCQRKANTESDSAYVFAAASLKDALEAVGDRFERETGLEIFFNFAGSNVLAHQIAASSRADLFLSADSYWMNFVEERKLLGMGTRRDFLSNRLVAICSKDAPWNPENAESLCDLDFEFLCIGDPDAVPAGRYAREWLIGLRCDDRNVWETVSERVSPAPDVRSALAQTLSRTDSIGIVYFSDYLLSEERSRFLFEAPNRVARYPIAMTKSGMDKLTAGKFFLYLQSEESLAVFKRFGFGPAEIE